MSIKLKGVLTLSPPNKDFQLVDLSREPEAPFAIGKEEPPELEEIDGLAPKPKRVHVAIPTTKRAKYKDTYPNTRFYGVCVFL